MSANIPTQTIELRITVPSKSKNHPDHEMDADSEDDIPLSELSRMADPAIAGEDERISKKRTRPASPPAPEEPNHSKRRTASFTNITMAERYSLLFFFFDP